MYIRTKAERGGFFLMAFALFYLAIGVHVLHPHLHDHAEHGYEDGHQAFSATVHHHDPNHDFLSSDSHQSCVICGLLAVCQVTSLDTVQFSVPLYPRGTQCTEHLVDEGTTSRPCTFIRGPPQYLS